MNILLYLLILILGGIVGYKKWLKPPLMEKLNTIQNLSLLLLLFIMGINIGLDEEVINSFGRIGFHAVVLAMFSITFSIIGVKLVSRIVLRQEERVKNDG